ncbi:MAG: M64 family metallopeptidase [Granulosicoccus sp.]
MCKIVLLLASCGLLLSACDAPGLVQAPVVAIDDSALDNRPVAGVFSNEAGVATLEFTIDEDHAFDGQFLLPDSSGQSPVTPSGERDMSSVGFIIVSLPTSGILTLRSAGQVFNYEPQPDYSGTDSFVYATPDGDDITVSITINPVPDAPVLDKNVATVADQGRLYSAHLSAVDADGDELRYSAENLPDWLTLDSQTGVMSGVPQQSDVGQLGGITLTVIDSTGLTDTITDFQMEVKDINDAPMLNVTQVPREFFGRQSVMFDVYPDDIDNDSVTVSVEPDPMFETSVIDGRISLEVNDVIKATSTMLTIVGRDERGAVVREEIPVDIFPRTASGKGTTVLGYKQGRGVHIVILGDGYAEDEARTFRGHVEDVLDNIRSDEGIAEHLGAFNIHMIQSVSRQSGADDGDQNDTVDTVFDSTYNCRSVPRLICANVLKLYEASLAEYPAVDQIILLVNDLRFGGSGNSGGRIAITSAFYPEIALHEMGHSLADLADEYVDPLILATPELPPFEEGRFRNISTSSDPVSVPWAHWIDPSLPLPNRASDEGVGVFEGGLYRSTGVYRGTADSRMRSYSEPFGPVNTEQWILRLYTLTDGIRKLSPQVQAMQVVAGQPNRFSVEPIFGFDVQKISWSLNGLPLRPAGEFVGTHPMTVAPGSEVSPLFDTSRVHISTDDSLAFEAQANETLSELDLSLPPGQHQLSLTVSDTSNRIRVKPPHSGIFTWTWSISAL